MKHSQEVTTATVTIRALFDDGGQWIEESSHFTRLVRLRFQSSAPRIRSCEELLNMP